MRIVTGLLLVSVSHDIDFEQGGAERLRPLCVLLSRCAEGRPTYNQSVLKEELMSSHAKAVHQVGQRVLEGEVMVYARVREGVRWPLRQPCLGPIRAPQA